MNCPFCGSGNPHSATSCAACGSNIGRGALSHRNGSGNNNASLKTGGGLAGAGILVALAKLKFLPFLLLKIWWMTRLFHMALLGGVWGVVGIVLLLAMVGGTLFRFTRRRVPVRF